MQGGKDWGLEGQTVPVLKVVGRGENGSVEARQAFNSFSESLWTQLPGGEAAAKPSTRRMGQQIEWTIEAHLLDTGGSDQLEEGEE